jgi:RHS repeat-associated protein
MPPFTYDNNGNMTNDTFRTYAWYVDNKLGSINSTTCNIFGSTDGTCILYDAFGREVERGVNGAYNEVMYTPVGKTAIMNGETTTVSAYFHLPGGGTYFQSGSTGANGYFWHKDWLGSVRLSSLIANRTVYFDRQFAPFGESYSNFGNATGLDFTGDTQDSFVGLLYDTPSREYHPGQGRWLSPDPSGLNAVDPTNPQSWNGYAYALNNPLNYTDPTGLECVWDDGSYDSNDDPETGRRADGTHPGCEGNGGQWVDHSYFQQNGLADWSGDPNGGIANYAQNFTATVTATGPPTCFPTSSLNWSQKAQLTAARFYAGLTGLTFGFGAGLDAGAGIGSKGSSWNFGAGGSASTLIVADGSGNSGFLNSASGGFAAVKMTGAGSWWGAGAAAGPSVLVSPNPIGKIAGPSGSFSAGGGAVLGAGISVTTSVAATVTFGVGAGTELGFSPQFGTSQFIPFCHN